MGLSFSCPFAEDYDLEQSLQSVVVKSIGFDGQKTPVRSISFKGDDPDAKILRPMGSGRMWLEGSVSFRTEEGELTNSLRVPCKNECEINASMDSGSKGTICLPSRSDSIIKSVPDSPVPDPSYPKHEAAIKLQKVYKSFRTRRKLADGAVLIEQSWWKLLDFAELKHSSISFFDLQKHETALSRWSRARTRAAKVGKGLSKNEKAQKLALQHWLEAIDPRHRYGHNLHFYYVKWLHSQSKQPFFYWLDIGEGKEMNLDKCTRCNLQQQCIKYLGPMERKAYEVAVTDGKFVYKETGELLDTSGEPKGAKWIFVLSTSRTLYVGKKKKGTFQHSSFLAGGAALAAGRVIVEKGILKAVWPHSGHYRPTPENFHDFISFLTENDVDLAEVKLDPMDEEEGSVCKKVVGYSRSNSSDDDLPKNYCLDAEENGNEDRVPDGVSSTDEKTAAIFDASMSSTLHDFGRKLSNLEIPRKDDLFERLRSENHADLATEELFPPNENHTSPKHYFHAEELDETTEEVISEQSVLQRINSRKGMNSYQLGEQLSCKWSTGAGPRIGCLRDYPSGLQSHALEQVSLSPRRIRSLRLDSPCRASTPNSFSSEIRTSHQSPLQFSPLCKGRLAASTPEQS